VRLYGWVLFLIKNGVLLGTLKAAFGYEPESILFTTGADTTVPEFLYAKMVAGYTPGVGVLGTISTIGAVVLLIGGYLVVLALNRRRQAAA